ncbi:hypothetical protein GW17_00016937 [Ensete ventricosum]|nr:hypothetical protein GW17_00016937 [Ensete ventricosum]
MICCASGCVVADSQQPTANSQQPTAAKRTMVPDCTKNASLSIPVPRDSRGDGSVRHHIMCGVTKIEDLVQSTEMPHLLHLPPLALAQMPQSSIFSSSSLFGSTSRRPTTTLLSLTTTITFIDVSFVIIIDASPPSSSAFGTSTDALELYLLFLFLIRIDIEKINHHIVIIDHHYNNPSMY